jgi:hypothetical protein
MIPKSLIAPLAGATILAAALMLPAAALAHDRHHGGHHGHHHGWSHPVRHKHKHKHKHKRKHKVVHEHHYYPVQAAPPPRDWRGRHDRGGYGERNRITITYSGGWD